MNAARQVKPNDLKDLVLSASRALAHLDADRLEELALSCAALNRNLPRASMAERTEIFAQLRAAVPQMVTLARMLDVTRANLDVIHRLREIRMGQTGYEDGVKRGWIALEDVHGLH